MNFHESHEPVIYRLAQDNVRDGLVEHLVRGIVGISALSYAISISVPHPFYSLALAGVSMVAFRGCPICWTIGLVETTYRMFKRHHAAP
ncbi:hypothetical protein ACC728_26800 [Rhizobium ruizarguesonis]